MFNAMLILIIAAMALVTLASPILTGQLSNGTYSDKALSPVKKPNT
jgi:hypothetical protein